MEGRFKGKGSAIRRKLCALCVMFAMAVCTGCSFRTTENEDISDRVQAFYDSVENVDMGTSGNENITLGVVNRSTEGEWYMDAVRGIQNAGNDYGVTLEMLDSEDDTKKEAEQIQSLVDKGVDAIVISPINADSSARALKAATEAEIPFITWNTIIGMYADAMICFDTTTYGKNSSDYLTKYAKTNSLKDLKLFLITNVATALGVEMCNGFKTGIKDMVDDGTAEVVAEFAALTTEDASEATKSMLEEHPEVNVVWAWSQDTLLGAIDAIRAAGRKDVIILGTEINMDLADQMLNDDEITLQAITSQLPYNMGYLAIVNAVKVVKGEEVEQKVLVPVSTVSKDDVTGIDRYIESHKEYVN